jgi:hypothetical protein
MLDFGDLEELVEMRARRRRNRHQDVARLHRGDEGRNRFDPVIAFDADDLSGDAGLCQQRLPVGDAVQQVAITRQLGAVSQRHLVRRLFHAVDQPVGH